MREIKLRAWDMMNKKWLPEHSIIIHKGKLLCNRFNVQDPIPSGVMGYMENIELMQFTGLQDKNGKDIYEGDVLDLENVGSNITETGYYVVRDMIKFIELKTLTNSEFGDKWDEAVIISNIHEATNERLKEWGLKE